MSQTMSHKSLGLTEATVRAKVAKLREEGLTNVNVLVVSTEWNPEYINQMTTLLVSELSSFSSQTFSINIVIRKVPGSWELPIGILKETKWQTYDVIIAVGVLIKGDTKHFEYISKSVFEGLMSLQLQIKIPIINGVLTVLNEEQIAPRIELAKGWAHSALMMCDVDSLLQ